MKRFVAFTAAVLSLVAAALASAQTYPTKPVHLIVAAAAGGSTDILGRLISARLGERLGQPFVVENRGGGGGSVAADFVSKQPADGYTLMMTNDQLVVQAATATASPSSKFNYDAIKDFTPIGILGRGPVVLGVHPSVPAKTVKELVALVKSQPKKWAFSSCGNGTVLHLAGELLNLAAGIDMAHVAYRGCTPAMLDAVSGQVPIFFTVLNNAVQFEKSGKVRVLGVASLTRLASMPNLPTIAESGFPGYDAYPWFGVVGPAGMPRDVVALLSSELAAAVGAPEMNKRLRGMFMEPATATPEAFAELMRSDLARWSRVVRDAKIHVD